MFKSLKILIYSIFLLSSSLAISQSIDGIQEIVKIHQDKINRVLKIRDKLFPDGKPQERISNFSEFYVNEGIDMISLIKNNLDPLSHKFSVIEI